MFPFYLCESATLITHNNSASSKPIKYLVGKIINHVHRKQ